jgi:hypothetical protein
VILGTFELGYEYVTLEVQKNQTGGAFTYCDSNRMRPVIRVGLNYEKFEKVVGCLVHESLEFVLSRLQARFSPSLELACDHSAYLFSFGHVTLSEASFMVAEYLTSVMPYLREAWEKREEPEE